MAKYQWEVRQTSVGGYVFAVWSDSGYAHYQTFKRCSTYYQRKIRRILDSFAGKGSIEIPRAIAWDEIQTGDFIRPFGAEAAS
jgi:hypothetical protein